MAISVSLSVRVPPDVRERLAAEARARRVTLGTHARDALAAGPAAGDGERGEDGRVVAEVRDFFRGFGPNHRAGVYAAVAAELARTVEGGGQAAIAASKELLTVIDNATIRFALDDEDEEEEDDGG